MTNTGQYCCFNCPSHDQASRRLDDICPSCGEPLDFPLVKTPVSIGEFEVEKPLSRGFYGATFVAERQTMVRRRNVLKVVPKTFYEFFQKDFATECQRHAELTENATHLVRIDDAFDDTVSFGSIVIDCHVAVLQYVEGDLLKDYLSGLVAVTAPIAAQIASDLFYLRHELASRTFHHNDFHPGNIIVERLQPSRHRPTGIEPSIRVMAIDFGSAATKRRSEGKHQSDIHWIADHLNKLSSLLSANDQACTDVEARLALALRMISHSLDSAEEYQRLPPSEEFAQRISDEYYRTAGPWRPWRNSSPLRTFGESYNAQTLDPWKVPQLLVDPNGRWQKTVAAAGPLVVTGMRGCGKTMLLRALQFHARVVTHERRLDEPTGANVIERLRGDGYVGFFVSASWLLTLSDASSLQTRPMANGNMFARLAIAYALEATRSLAHLEDLDPKAVHANSTACLSQALTLVLEGPEVKPTYAYTISQMEHELVRSLFDACRTDSGVKMSMHPSTAFPMLARAFRECTDIWSHAQILFLLDDVSTRYLDATQIEQILSTLIFQHPDCAFKVTSESQTIFLSLRSPGGVEPAAHWRDFGTFDLGADVHRRLKTGGGKKFIEDILVQRGQLYAPHPAATPSAVLGDRPLSTIARTIASSGSNSAARKRVYSGVSALRAVCVGDIGSAITIYERIISRSGSSIPVSESTQSDVFQESCSTHLYLLDRRGGDLKNVAKSFAAASYELMMQSARKGEDRGLRQYLSLCVRVTAGDKVEQGRRLRELVDAGVFVFQGGAPRTKTRDSDPVQQFKLTFRKIYGLADYIGLAERDRFELSGSSLEEWLTHPEDGKEILMRNLRTSDGPSDPDWEDDPTFDENEPSSMGEDEPAKKAVQPNLFDVRDVLVDNDDASNEGMLSVTDLLIPSAVALTESEASHESIDVLFLALGFEVRARVSAKRAISCLRPRLVLAVRYEKSKTGAVIASEAAKVGAKYSELDYNEIEGDLDIVPGSRVAIDITGFTKAAIFRLVRSTIAITKSTVVVHTDAKVHYPREDELSKILDAQSDRDYDQLLMKLKGVLSGEHAPYSMDVVHNIASDGTRMNCLMAFASAKHERLIHLIENRDYDQLKVVVDGGDSSRATVARMAAEVATRTSPAGSTELCNVNDLQELLVILRAQYYACYVVGGLNFEIGLTGDKIDTVAAAAFCANVDVNAVWYVKPRSFDVKRFTQGSGPTVWWRVSTEDGVPSAY